MVLVNRIKKVEKLVERMASVEHMNLTTQLQEGKVIHPSLSKRVVFTGLQRIVVTISISGYRPLTTFHPIMPPGGNDSKTLVCGSSMEKIT